MIHVPEAEQFVEWDSSEVKWTTDGWQLAVDLLIPFRERLIYEVTRQLESRLRAVYNHLRIDDQPFWGIDAPDGRSPRPCFWIRGKKLHQLSAAELHVALDSAIRAADAYLAKREPQEQASKTAWNNQFRSGDDSIDIPEM